MSLLSTIQEFCRMHALAVPTAVIGSSDAQVNQLYQVLCDLLGEIQTESKFSVTTRELVYSALPQEDQGHISDLGAEGFQYIIPGTLYNRTLGRPLQGPVDEAGWQELHAMPSAGAEYKYRLWNNHLFLYPAPTDPYPDIAFEYMSRYTTYDGGDVNAPLKNLPTQDSDTFVFPEPIIKRGLAFRWKQIKGLPYQADEMKFWDLLNNYISRDKIKGPIDVGQGADRGIKPGIFVPSNSWMQ